MAIKYDKILDELREDFDNWSRRNILGVRDGMEIE